MENYENNYIFPENTGQKRLNKNIVLVAGKKIWRWVNASRLRKILSITLITLITLNSMRLLFLPAKEVSADSALGFDEGYGTTATDRNSTLSGTITGAVWKQEEFCKSGKCLYFDGSGDKVDFGNDSDVNFTTGSFSIAGWFRAPDSATTRMIAAKHNATAGGYKVYLDANGYVVFGIDDDSSWTPDNTATTSTSSFDDNKWHHFEAVKNGTTSISIYVDGNLYQTTTGIVTASLTNANNFYVGIDGNGSSNGFSGFLDEIKVYSGSARSADEVKADFNGESQNRGVSVSFGPDQSWLTNGLVGYWKFDESSWTNNCTDFVVTDYSGNGNNLQSCPATTGPSVPSTGKFGKSGTFDGNDYFRASDSDSLDLLTGFTISMWVKPAGAQSADWARFADKGYSNSYFFGTGSGTGRDLSVWMNNTEILDTGEIITDSVWQLAVATWDGNKVTIFLNGEIVASANYSTALTANTSRLGIGSSGTGSDSYFNGSMDDVRIYNHALSPDEVAKLYSWAPGPVGHWKMDEQSATGGTAFDSSTYGNSGTIGGTTKPGVGKFGGGYALDGNDHIDISPSSSINNLPQLTAEAWIYPTDSSPGFQRIIAKNGASNTNTSSWNFEYTDDVQLAFFVRTNVSGVAGTQMQVNITTPSLPNKWSHVAVVWDGTLTTTSTKAYVNGVQMSVSYVGTPTGTVNDDSTENLCIGDRCSSPTDGLTGVIDDVRLYNYQRTTAQIVEDMNGGHPAPGSPVGSSIGYWKFDEGADNTCSGATNDVCNSGSQITNLDGTSTATRTNSGKFNKALSFNGTTSSVNLGTNSAVDDLPDSGGISVSAWIYPTGMGESSQGVIIAKNTGATPSGGWILQFAGTNALKFSVDGSTDLVRQTSNSIITLNSWNHVSLFWDGVITTASSVRIFVNGKETSYATTTDGASRVSDDASSLFIGNDSSGASTFAGTIDEVKLYNFALTSEQVKAEYNRGNSNLGSLSTESNGTTASWSDERSFCLPGDTLATCSPVGEWKLDENNGSAITYDTSAGSKNGTLSNIENSDWVAGKIGSGLNLDGTNEYVDIGTGPSTVRSVSFWVKPATTTEYFINLTSNTDYIWANGASGITATGFTSASIYLNGRLTSGATPVTAGVWQHIVITSSTAENASNLDIGRTQDTNYLEGTIDQVRLYDYTLTASQVAWDYNRGGPVGWWKMDESSWNNNCSTDTVFDSSGKTNHGDSCSAGNGQTTPETGKFNSAMHFDDVNDYVSVADNSSLDLTAGISISAWVNTDANEADNVIVSKGTSYEMGINADGDMYWYNGSTTDDDASAKILTGSWHHVVITNNDTTVTYYVDGVQTGTDASGIGADNATALTLGYDGLNYFDGLIDDVRIFNYVLTPQQIKILFNENASLRFGPVSGSP